MKHLPIQVVVSKEEDRLPDTPRVRFVLADTYLAGRDPTLRGPAVIVNLCRDVRYLSRGYYVSLIADARGQHCEPTVDTLRNLLDEHVVFRALEEASIPTLDSTERAARVKTPKPAEEATIWLVAGQTADPRFRALGRRLHTIWPHPLLRVDVVREQRAWRVWKLQPVTLDALPDAERARLGAALAGPLLGPQSEASSSLSLAVLFDENDPRKPSHRETIDRLARIGARLGVHVARIGLDELQRLGEYDALFIRTLTGVREPSFRFARRAEALWMPVIDDTRSILRCGNKVWLHELLDRHGLATPDTVLAGADTTFQELADALGTPFVVKLPDGSFSQSVNKVATAAEWRKLSGQWLSKSPLLVAQRFMKTDFDWRVTVLDGRPLFTARYHMAKDHWQIAKNTPRGTTYGKTEAIARREADPEVVGLACAAASLVGDGLYGVDLKQTPDGPVVIEINDNPNLDTGYDDQADGNLIYEDLIRWFAARVEKEHTDLVPPPELPRPDVRMMRTPVQVASPQPQPPYKPWEVVGLEIEYPIVDAGLNATGLVADVLRELAGRPTSGVELGVVGLSNEIVDHVLEIKTVLPLTSLVDTEVVLAETVRRVNSLLAARGARLMPTGMHPWLDPKRTRLWARSGRKIYATYARLFDVHTHGWANVQATHVNLPVGDEADVGPMMNAAALLVPYLPALAASSPMFDAKLQPSVDNRLAFIIEHQARITESCGEIVPEYTTGLAAYKRDVLQPMYAAVDRLPDAGLLRHEYFNARGAVLKMSRQSMEVRVLDTQECVRMDCAIASFTRAALRWLAPRAGDPSVLPPHGLLVQDFRAVVAEGSNARVRAPHLLPDGGTARDALGVVLAGCREHAPREEQPYLDLVADVIREGSLSERMAAFLRPHADDPEALARVTRRLYEDLSECLVDNRPWAGRNLS